MLHNHHVDVIEHTQVDKLLFAAQEVDLARFTQLVAVLDLHKFLRGDSHQHNVAGELFQDAGAGQSVAHTHH